MEGLSMNGEDSDSETLPRWMQVICGTISILSMLGSLAIILTYVLVKDIRSKARELLVHLSLMDLLYSTANFVGLALPYHKYLHDDGDSNFSSVYNVSHETLQLYVHICNTQAFLAIYGTIGSVLWTLGLAVYLYYRVVSRDAIIAKRLVRILYVVCYALPLYVSLWLLLDHHTGYSYYATSGAGWCFVNDDIKTIELFMLYDIWLWLGVVILIPLYLTIHIHARDEVCIVCAV